MTEDVMQPFLPAKELKQKYGIYGHFYTVELPGEDSVECRSVLEIVEHEQTPQDLSRLNHRRPDAVMIMMNPGSSKPLVEVNNRIAADAVSTLPVSLVPTRPDTTQYQVMRLMWYRNWQHVRVLNLSDLRSPKSAEFIRMFQKLEQDHSFEAHSVFAEARQDELDQKLPRARNMPLVLAWGLSDKLAPLIERCLERIGRRKNCYGLPAPGTPPRYRHPLPSLQQAQREWVHQMLQQLAED